MVMTIHLLQAGCSAPAYLSSDPCDIHRPSRRIKKNEFAKKVVQFFAEDNPDANDWRRIAEQSRFKHTPLVVCVISRNVGHENIPIVHVRH